jgi:hypothetical protein
LFTLLKYHLHMFSIKLNYVRKENINLNYLT